MATDARPERNVSSEGLTACPYVQEESPTRRRLELRRHQWLHEDGRRLITTWFQRAWDRRLDEEATFESFIFAWISVNAWAACITEKDLDREYMRMLKADAGLCELYQKVLHEDDNLRRDAEAFTELLPIFRAQRLRRVGVRPPEGATRRELIQHYLTAGVMEFEPECGAWHLSRGEAVPNDWPHVMSAIYRVRCNLFHGEKSAHSEMDRRIVRAAFLTLTGFFRRAGIL